VLLLSFDPRSQRVLGAAAVGPHAADTLAPIALAVQQQLAISDLAAVFAANPTMGEVAFAAARAALEWNVGS